MQQRFLTLPNIWRVCLRCLLLACSMRAAVAAEPGLLLEGSRALPVEADFVRQQFPQPWVLERLSRSPARIRQRLLLTAPGADANASLVRITPVPPAPGQAQPDYLVRDGDKCRIFIGVGSGRTADDTDQMHFSCTQALDVAHYRQQRDACAAQGGTWEMSGLYPNGKCLPDNRARCTARGGTWKRKGWWQELLCEEETPDGGKSCTDGSQCAAKICLQHGPEKGPVDGRCPKIYGPVLGCFTAVKEGVLQPTLCAD